MISFDGFAARVTQIGGDRHLVTELEKEVGSRDGWVLESVLDVETAIARLLTRNSLAVILNVTDEHSYAQAIKYLSVVDSVKSPAVIVHDCLQSHQLLQLLQCGAVECLRRPLNISRLALVLDMLAAPRRAGARRNNGDLPSADVVDLGLSPQLVEQIRAVAPLDTTVLVTGETGVGKTRLSRLVHRMSPRCNKPFVALNCGALSESLLDSELFGHCKGAFTGADRDAPGKLALSADGTLLLDEVDALSPAAQVKLLQVTEERLFQPVGSTKFEPLRSRLMVASNKDLREEVAAGRFRSDLYYRLNVMAFHLLPLRERQGEVRRLVDEFTAEFAAHHGRAHPTIASEAMSALNSHTWPGNVRELRNVIERAVILSSAGSVELSHLPNEIQVAYRETSTGDVAETVGNRLAQTRSKAERAELIQALEQHENNRTRTAAYLGISRVALYKRLRKFHIL